MLAPILLVLLCGTIETGVIYLAQSNLQFAIDTASRQIRTGSVQSQSLSSSGFRNLVCNNFASLLTCDGNLFIDVRSYSSFSSASYPPPLNQNGTINNNNMNSYQPGVGGNIVLVRAIYTWQVATPGLDWFLVNMANGQHMLSASAAFRNEPF